MAGSISLIKRLAGIGLAILLAACTVPQPYRKPVVELPTQWKLEAPWRASAPNDAAPRGPWWSRYQDATLDALQTQALAGSPTLAIAAARVTQARAGVDAARAGLFPQVSLATREARLRIAANRPLTNYNAPNFTTIQSDYQFTFNVNYELDMWGRVRTQVESARVGAEQSQADLENVRLVLTADLAANYFNLRQIDIELDVLDRSIRLQQRALELAKARHELGVASGIDVAQQQALIDNTLTQVEILRRQRSQFENAIATLMGLPASSFTLATDIRPRQAPQVPAGLPSDLLERRPDVASAERAVMAANAQLGIARTAYYPSFNLGSLYGMDSRNLATVLQTPSMIWSLGLALAQPLFDGGRMDANVAAARAGYEATVSNYRRVVLTAVQEVEDGMLGSVALDRAHAQAEKAAQSAAKVLQLANDRYEGGVANYLEVITAQQALLNAQRQVSQLLGQRLLVSVFLVKALGGDWQGMPAAAKP